MSESLSQERLRELLDYDPASGFFFWKVAKGVRLGQRAGSQDGKGYLLITVRGKRYQASRLAFLWMAGKWPRHDVDHRNSNSLDNRWANLREATTSQNLQYKRIQKNNKCGLKGIVKFKQKGIETGQWRSRIKADGRHIHLGLFSCPAAAHLAYVLAAHTYFGDFAKVR